MTRRQPLGPISQTLARRCPPALPPGLEPSVDIELRTRVHHPVWTVFHSPGVDDGLQDVMCDLVLSWSPRERHGVLSELLSGSLP